MCVWLALVPWPAASSAEQLPFRHYGPAQGLAGSLVRAIHQDRQGYLWLGATDGLARFDGYRFVNYGLRDGLGTPAVNAIAEDREGRLWFGTNGAGVARLVETRAPLAPDRNGNAPPQPKFQLFRVAESEGSNRVNQIAFGGDGAIWCLTDQGLYRGDPEARQFAPVLIRGPRALAMPMLLDSRGRVWAGIDEELVLVENGSVTRWAPPDAVATHSLRALVEDVRARIIAANLYGLFEYLPPARQPGRGSWRRLPLRLAPLQQIRTLWAAPDDVFWIGTTYGLIRYDGGAQTLYTAQNGLRGDNIWSVHGDREGNLWIGTDDGPARLPARAPSSWTVQDGLPENMVERVIEARDGRLYVRTSRGGFAELRGGKALVVPGSQHPSWNRLANMQMATQLLQDRRGDWWVTNRTSVQRFAGPALQFKGGERFGAAHGFPRGTEFSGGLGGILEDADGGIWIASRRGLFHSEDPKRGPPSFSFLPLVGFVERDVIADLVQDRSGTIWFRTHRDLARVVNGRIERLLPDEWLPVAIPMCLFVDSRGRLWVGRRHRGLYMTADPAAAKPLWVRYSTEQGLSSDTVLSLAEDRLGRIYAATPRGLDRLELDPLRVRTFTTRDGLAGAYVNDVVTDRRGQLWVATRTGLTRLDPKAEPRPVPAPHVRFTKIQVAGGEFALPERGVREMPLLRLGPSRNDLRIDYAAVSLGSEGSLRYQYRLEGVDAEWSPPNDQRSINFAHLAAGGYRFLVRAVTPEGAVGDRPATFAFQIAPPFWRSRWFAVAAALALAAVVEALHRVRLRRRLELESVRRRIATDLHDDIGSNLSRIAILSEVARRETDGGNPAVKERLVRIAAVSRDLVDSMADIVWAVNPARDRYRDLVRRMRHFADDVLSARDITLVFDAPDGQDVPLGADTRREVFLLFKEAVSNLARHSGCRNARIELGLVDGWLSLRVADDGRGFDLEYFETQSADGNGLHTMRRRARDLRGTFEIASTRGSGTTIQFRVPYRRRGWAGRLAARG